MEVPVRGRSVKFSTNSHSLPAGSPVDLSSQRSDTGRFHWRQNTEEPKVPPVCAWCQRGVTGWHSGLPKNEGLNIVYSCQLTGQARILFLFLHHRDTHSILSSRPLVRRPEKDGTHSDSCSSLDHLLIEGKNCQLCAGQSKPAGDLLPCWLRGTKRWRKWNAKIFTNTLALKFFFSFKSRFSFKSLFTDCGTKSYDYFWRVLLRVLYFT